MFGVISIKGHNPWDGMFVDYLCALTSHFDVQHATFSCGGKYLNAITEDHSLCSVAAQHHIQ
jgi:hypothetical protein